MSADLPASPEERVERVKMALAEIQPGEWEVGLHDDPIFSPTGWNIFVNPSPPRPVLWRAYMLANPDITPCWPCWSAGRGSRGRPCTHDPLTQPWPPPDRLTGADG